MALDGADDTPGYVVREFRTDGDGWFNYFGWPTDPDAPFLFTPQGTEIDSLVYGKLGVPRLSPWDDVPTELRHPHRSSTASIDPSGNIGAASSFDVTLLPATAGVHDDDHRPPQRPADRPRRRDLPDRRHGDRPGDGVPGRRPGRDRLRRSPARSPRPAPARSTCSAAPSAAR